MDKLNGDIKKAFENEQRYNEYYEKRKKMLLSKRRKISVRRMEVDENITCNSCGKHNFKESSINEQLFTNESMNEIKIGSQSFSLCYSCLVNLEQKIKLVIIEGEVGSST